MSQDIAESEAVRDRADETPISIAVEGARGDTQDVSAAATDAADAATKQAAADAAAMEAEALMDQITAGRSLTQFGRSAPPASAELTESTALGTPRPTFAKLADIGLVGEIRPQVQPRSGSGYEPSDVAVSRRRQFGHIQALPPLPQTPLRVETDQETPAAGRFMRVDQLRGTDKLTVDATASSDELKRLLLRSETQEDDRMPLLSSASLALLSRSDSPTESGQIPADLGRRMAELDRLANEDPEVALSLAASAYILWNNPEHSEYILEQVIATARRVTGDRGLESTLTWIRRFVQLVSEDQLVHRAELRMGRLYYEHGYFAKAAAELDVDPSVDDPDEFESLAGLVKAISLVRLRQTKDAMPLLDWVATRSPQAPQRARAASLLGRLLVLHKRPDEARPWLNLAIEQGGDADEIKSARELLEKINERD